MVAGEERLLLAEPEAEMIRRMTRRRQGHKRGVADFERIAVSQHDIRRVGRIMGCVEVRATMDRDSLGM